MHIEMLQEYLYLKNREVYRMIPLRRISGRRVVRRENLIGSKSCSEAGFDEILQYRVERH